ncbi:hypothetical protein E1B28_007451 [Marasmius oreades]|uniref:Uncharacterized protein n=1 Tax=Marasmius oreades TaxID=181124 RepID=A0A9P7S1R3_9AGAR|nr:uncharacterized protein E1B28_007451 [Marasmius oreades]KAG7093809.1 hypothetical protein E1B28_007451 [Marasmius oreades]
MALFQATIICCKHLTTHSCAEDFRHYITTWVESLRTIYPHTRERVPRTNIHGAGHVYDFLVSFGPVSSWWCFPFERLIGTLQKVNTNDHIGGIAEATMMKTMAQTANVRHWLRRPDCPEAIRQLKQLFDKCFIPANTMQEQKPLQELKSTCRAYANHDGVNFSPHQTHEGNTCIIYKHKSAVITMAGQIQWIQNIPRPGGGQDVRLHV